MSGHISIILYQVRSGWVQVLAAQTYSNTVYEQFNIYKNRNVGVWVLEGKDHIRWLFHVLISNSESHIINSSHIVVDIWGGCRCYLVKSSAGHPSPWLSSHPKLKNPSIVIGFESSPKYLYNHNIKFLNHPRDNQSPNWLPIHIHPRSWEWECK